MPQKKKRTTSKPIKGSFLTYEMKLIIIIAVTLFLALFVYTNLGGVLGHFVKESFLGLFGFATFFIPPMFFGVSLLALNPNFRAIRTRMISGFVLLFVSIILFLGLIHRAEILEIMARSGSLNTSYETGITQESAGVIGNFLGHNIMRLVGLGGQLILTLMGLLLSFFMIANIGLSDIKNTFKQFGNEQRARREAKDRLFEERSKKLQAEEQLMPLIHDDEPSDKFKKHAFTNDLVELNEPVIREPVIQEPEEQEPAIQTEPTEQKKIEAPTELETRKVETDIQKSLEKKEKPYRKPKLEFLHSEKRSAHSKESNDKVIETSRKLERILDSFGVKAKVIEITKGPILNRFEMEVAAGTKISKIVGLSDDIALNLAVSQVRVAPVPNKVAVGIEVPSQDSATVYLKDILRSSDFNDNPSKLKFALGKDISGKSVVADLSKMPHLLIAGTTGSGKSVCVNTIIMSILYHATPEEVKLLMIDPKVVELNIYNGIPHLILPVVTDPKKAAIALGWAVNEMTRRYEEFAKTGTKDISSYNAKNPEDKMPKIIVLIDELSDLMMVAPNQVEDAIARLAQMARAAGIHLIVATQRPSVDVITGLIKANVPSRISFAVSSGIDSRTILDTVGAEKLLGKGDMLFHPIGTNRPRRVQGAFVSETEIAKVVDFIKNQELDTDYDESILEKPVAATVGDFEDDLLEEAIKTVIEMKSASASMLQRKFRIGYNRAGRLIDMMEERGIVGPPQGSKPRDVIVDDFNTTETDEQGDL